MAVEQPLFTRNTFVHGHGWFGPDHLAAVVTPEVEAAVRKARGLAPAGGSETPPPDGSTPPDGAGGDGGPPPKAGAGATTEAWAAYARANDVQVPDDAGRGDIIAALDEVGVPTE